MLNKRNALSPNRPIRVSRRRSTKFNTRPFVPNPNKFIAAAWFSTRALSILTVRMTVRNLFGRRGSHRDNLYIKHQIDACQRMIGVEPDVIALDFHNHHHWGKTIFTRLEPIALL